jgi:4-diphosphocytidyl-2-C-methyl-D-erythritol kinase
MIRLLAPAKINLGLEILGRRPDGYHEIRTVLAAVTIFDRVDIERAHQFSFLADDPALDNEANLAARAALELRVPAAVRLWKRTPAAAGLGGASSDAAAALRGIARLWPNLSQSTITKAASALGSDVPFFLGGGPALASGRGEELREIEAAPRFWLVVAIPDLAIPDKTATLYRSLVPADFSDGARVEAVAASLARGIEPTTEMLANAFERPLYERWPEARQLRETMASAGAGIVALSGAGPAHYAICRDLPEAVALAAAVRTHAGPSPRLIVCRFMAGSTPCQAIAGGAFRTSRQNRT